MRGGHNYTHSVILVVNGMNDDVSDAREKRIIRNWIR